jgi:glycosyltransferase involved in cell wall biosynthesis
MNSPAISVMIRNYNEATSLKKCLASVKQQVTRATVEIVILDNESTDDSVAIAQSFGAKIYTLSKSEFTFGHALNKGISYCTGEFILLLSSHVVLLTAHFIEDFLIYLEDEKVGGMRFCISSSHRMILDDIKPRRLTYSQIATDPDERAVMKHWDEYIVANCSVIRKSCWQMQPFNETIIASEDKLWSIEILKKGYDILYHTPCYFAYFKQMTPQQYSKKYLIENVASYQIGKLPQRSYMQIMMGGFRALAGGSRKAIKDSYRQLLNDLKVKRAVRKNSSQP